MNQPLKIVLPILDQEIPNLKQGEVDFTIISTHWNGDESYETCEVTPDTVNIVRLIGCDRSFCEAYKKARG